MAIDRSKYKQTSVSQLAQADKELNQTLGKKSRTGNGHEIEEGLNLFRAYPAHAGGKPTDLFCVPFVQTFIPAMVQDKDKDGKPLTEGGKTKMKLSVKPVWNAKAHGGKPKDLVEEYITLALKNAKAWGLSESERKEYLKPIYGQYSKDKSKNVMGINYPLAWVMYADKYPAANPAATPTFDELKIKKGVKERLNKIAQIEAGNDPLGTDPFTHIEEGRAFKIIKDTEQENPNNIYTTELDNSTTTEVLAGGRTVKVQKTYPLTDEQLEHFENQKPLREKYGAQLATRKNFETQLTGLQLLDDKYSMKIFSMDEWADIVAEIDSYYPEVDEPVKQAEDNNTDEEEVFETEESGDEFDLMDRRELAAFAKANKTGIIVKPTMKESEIRDQLRSWKETSVIPEIPLPGEDGYTEEVEETPAPEVKAENSNKEAFLKSLTGGVQEEVVEKSAAATTSDPKARLAALRAKMKSAS